MSADHLPGWALDVILAGEVGAAHLVISVGIGIGVSVVIYEIWRTWW